MKRVQYRYTGVLDQYGRFGLKAVSVYRDEPAAIKADVIRETGKNPLKIVLGLIREKVKGKNPLKIVLGLIVALPAVPIVLVLLVVLLIAAVFGTIAGFLLFIGIWVSEVEP